MKFQQKMYEFKQDMACICLEKNIYILVDFSNGIMTISNWI